MQLHQIKPKNINRSKKRIGRGGKRGTFSGKGAKGQLSRAGRKLRPELREIVKKIPKKRGYDFKSFRIKPQIVNLKDLDEKFKNGDIVSPETLIEKGLIVKLNNRIPIVKILGDGKLTKKLKVENCKMSASAKKVLG
ncbi:MAG TPA: uL15 family ribosomal protein [Candidatus Portnoybacteria bacterium]|jgi:large subunit ribosomal protein L15|nr:uL15 family ribosomal protein [Candidatus Portnoybacteria bacterium]MDD5751935.1 uL15 family ribosomal protein [Candidatus Portnoybacteria bacterium]HOZ16261.1 uL15 family ribosomal protein [Candidatus Portnoybacteria bacterium]HPH51943.1 uL15 family ribosomal protein [Candidatus Portnoybacteria bacterium]HPJ80156.1 uL15 family ribosomal protein [Candidatus Portnoybacteria bacterium]